MNQGFRLGMSKGFVFLNWFARWVNQVKYSRSRKIILGLQRFNGARQVGRLTLQGFRVRLMAQRENQCLFDVLMAFILYGQNELVLGTHFAMFKFTFKLCKIPFNSVLFALQIDHARVGTLHTLKFDMFGYGTEFAALRN